MDSETALRLPSLLVGGILCLLVGSGCSVSQPDPRQEMSEMAPADGWDSRSDPGEVPDDWLGAFEDPVLIGLVEEAQIANPNLAATAAALASAVAQARQVDSALYPSLDLEAGARQTHRFELTERDKLLQIEQNETTLGIGLALQWELDVWQRVSDSAKGAAMAASATAADYAFARQSLAAQVAKGWFQAVTNKLQFELATRFVQNFEEAFRIAQARFDAGDVSAQDVFSARADVAAARQASQQALFATRSSIRALEILLGRYPAADLALADSLAADLPPVPADLPSTLLERRPDLIAADREVAASFYLAKAAAAARLPTFSLTANYNSSAETFGDLFDASSMLANLGINLFQPLFDAGLLKNRFLQAEAEQMSSVAQYKATALNAFQEVEDTLNLESSLKDQIEQLKIASDNLENAAKVAQVRYREGETDMTSFLVVQRQSLDAQSTLIRTRGALLTNRVDLYLALGGNFEKGPINDSPLPPLLPSQKNESTKQK